MRRQPSRRRGIALALGLCAVVLVSHARSYLPFFADDGFISLRYADRLLHGQGLTWSDGERVEGYSNFLWVLGCAGFGALHVDLVTAARILGLGASLAALAALARWTRSDLPPWRAALAFSAGGLVFAASGPVAAWSIGGLEQPLVVALLLWGLVGLARLPQRSGDLPWRAAAAAALPLGLLAWARPDGILLSAAVLAADAAMRWTSSHGTAKQRAHALVLPALVSLGPAIFAAVQLAFRLAYYGEWVPNTALVKLALTSERARDGWAYIATSLSVHVNALVLSAAAVLPAIYDKHARRRILLLLAPLLAWIAYVIVIGGDIFPARRHYVVVLALQAALVVEAVGWAARRSLPWRGAAAIGSLVVVLFGALRQTGDPEQLRAGRERWEWLGQPIGKLLGRHFGAKRALLAADSAGTLPYFSRLPAIDMLGLNDKTLAHQHTEQFGHGALGHELGDGAYVLSRRPDLVIFGLPTGEEHALYRSGIEMQRDQRFAAQYALLTFEADGDSAVRSRIWLKTAGAIGIEADSGAVRIPGYMLASLAGTVAREDAGGNLGCVITPYAAGRVDSVPVSPGRWTLQAEYTGPPPRLIVSSGDIELASGEPELSFSLSDTQHSVRIDAKSARAALTHIRSLRLQSAQAPSP